MSLLFVRRARTRTACRWARNALAFILFACLLLYASVLLYFASNEGSSSILLSKQHSISSQSLSNSIIHRFRHAENKIDSWQDSTWHFDVQSPQSNCLHDVDPALKSGQTSLQHMEQEFGKALASLSASMRSRLSFESTYNQVPFDAKLRAVQNQTIVYHVGGVGCSGFFIEAANLIYALSKFVHRLHVLLPPWICHALPRYVMDSMNRLSSTAIPNHVDILFSHATPNNYPIARYPTALWSRRIETRPRIVIGRAMTETSVIPKLWTTILNDNQRVDAVFITAAQQMAPFLYSAVKANKMYVLPEPLDPELFSINATNSEDEEQSSRSCVSTGILELDAEGRVKRREGLTRVCSAKKADDPSDHILFSNSKEMSAKFPCSFRFLFNAKMEARKGWKELLLAFLTEFKASEKVCLVFHTHIYGDRDPQNAARASSLMQDYLQSEHIEDLVKDKREVPWRHVHIHTRELSSHKISQMYRNADALVIPTRGEGWYLPAFEALALGVPVIISNSSLSGYMAVLNQSNAIILPLHHWERVQGHDFDPNALWSVVSVRSLRHAMRAVVQDHERAKQLAAKGQSLVRAQLSHDAVARIMIERMYDLLQRFNGSQPAF